jgi:hypothetical protein
MVDGNAEKRVNAVFQPESKKPETETGSADPK